MVPQRGLASSSRLNISSASATASSTSTTSSMLTSKHILNLKLIKLYGRHECLWNINHKNFLVGAAQRSIWSKIAHELDPEGGISVDFCRNRIQELRQYYNYLNLQKLRTFKRRNSLPYTPLCLGPCRFAAGLTFLSLGNASRDVPMSGCIYNVKRSDELLPKDWVEHAFSFLHKNFIKIDYEEGDRKGRSKGEK